MADHYHAVVWIDHKRARVFHFNVDEADKTVVRDHVVRDLHSRERRTGHRIEENKPFFEDVAKTIADAGAILIVGPAQEKDLFAKFLAEKHPAIRMHVEGVEKADHPTDGEAPRPCAPLCQSRRPHAALRPIPREPGKP